MMTDCRASWAWLVRSRAAAVCALLFVGKSRSVPMVFVCRLPSTHCRKYHTSPVLPLLIAQTSRKSLFSTSVSAVTLIVLYKMRNSAFMDI